MAHRGPGERQARSEVQQKKAASNHQLKLVANAGRLKTDRTDVGRGGLALRAEKARFVLGALGDGDAEVLVGRGAS